MEITRDEALEEIKKNPYPTEEMLLEDREYLIKNLVLLNKNFKT